MTRARSQVVSRTSAARFAARARARRWWSWRAALAVLGTLVALAVATWVLLASPLLAVRDIGVVGAERIDPAEVREVSAAAVGTPLARVDTEAIERRVAGLELVKEVDVVRAWPRTVEIRLVERVPVAAVPADGGFDLVDAEAVVVAQQPEAPPDLPVLRLDLRSADPASVQAAAEVVTALPEDLRAHVEQVSATSPDDVRLRLRDGGEVIWGAPADSALKADVLQALRGSRPADVYDVSAPLVPVTR